MKLLDVSFGTKLGGAFGIILVLLCAIATMGYISTRNIAEQAHNADEANKLALNLGAKIVDHFEWLNVIDRFLVQPEGKRLELEVDDHKCKLGQWLYGQERAQIIARFPETEANISKLESSHSRLHASSVQIKRLFENGTELDAALDKAHKTYAQETLPALKQVQGHLEALQNELVESDHNSNTKLIKMVDTTQRNIVLAAIMAIALAVCFAFLMTRYVASRVKKLMGFAENIANGDFTASMTVSADDELGRLAKALNHMRTSLGMLLGDFVAGVTHLSASSQELFGISKDMADGSVNMSESSITVAAAAEEMSSNMNSVAAASEQAATNINMVAAAAEELTATVSEIAQSSETARSISEEAVSTASNASDRVNELGATASQINKVTEVITEISEQTNLLALNATIEAARAGEAGKGFAVVANEIKELAKQTAHATQDIKSEIEGMQTTTQSTVGEINQISEVINRVNDIVATIASNVEEQSTTTQEIATNVAQASEGIQEVNVNVSQSASVSSEIARDIAIVSQVSEDITNSSSTVSANAGDLSGFTAKLKDTVGEFRLPTDMGTQTKMSMTDQADRDVPDLIRWNDQQYTVNIAVMDKQHKKLVGLINKLHRAMKTGQAGSSITLILSELVDYTVTHFKDEENIMRQNGYEGLDKQIEQHQDLVQQVAAAQEKICSGNAMLSMDVMDFLKDWLMNHIQGEDKKYGPFLNSKGIT